MTSQGPLSAGAGANIAGAYTDWTTPGNIVSSNNLYAEIALAPAGLSNLLEASSFGFSIPVGATINGIVVEIERKISAGAGVLEDWQVLIVKGGVGTGNQHQIAGIWPGTDTYQTYGNSSDLWGTTWTPADINAANFGVRLAVQETFSSNSVTGEVDHIRITVYYTPPPGRSIAPGILGI